MNMICFEYSAAGCLVKEGGKTYRYGGYIASNMAWLEAFYENN